MSQPSEGSGSQPSKYCIKLSGGNVLSVQVAANAPCPSGYSAAPSGYSGGTPPAIGNPYSPNNPVTGQPSEIGRQIQNVPSSVAKQVIPGYQQISDAFNAISSHLLDPNLWKGVGLVGLALVVGVAGLFLLNRNKVMMVAKAVT